MKSRSIEGDRGSGLRARLSAWFSASAWAPLVGKVLAYGVGFGVLALVGSGAMEGLLSRASGASAAPANSVSATASASAAPLVLRAEASEHAEVAAVADAGAGAATLTDAGTDTVTATVTDAGAGTGTGTGAGTDAGAATEKRAAPASGVTPDGKVALNVATEDDLRRLPGIGPSKAKAILALRAKLGRFRRAEDLLRVKGIGRRKLARLRPLLVVEPP